jgi:hypothetical protein
MVGTTTITASAAGCNGPVNTTAVTNGNANGYYRSFFSSDIHIVVKEQNRKQERPTGTLILQALRYTLMLLPYGRGNSTVAGTGSSHALQDGRYHYNNS